MFRSVAADTGRSDLSSAQQCALVVLRTLIGWHFLYEGYYKWVLPGWDRAGQPVPDWSAAGYLTSATGPLAPLFHWLGTGALVAWVDPLVVAAMIAAGVALMLGAFTQAGACLALLLLSSFYLAHIPMAGRQLPGTEGAYLLVNKTLIEAAAVLTVLVFRTGRIAGLDLLRARFAAGRAALRRGASSGTQTVETTHGAHA